jgi:hypothetical protein
MSGSLLGFDFVTSKHWELYSLFWLLGDTEEKIAQ